MPPQLVKLVMELIVAVWLEDPILHSLVEMEIRKVGMGSNHSYWIGSVIAMVKHQFAVTTYSEIKLTKGS